MADEFALRSAVAFAKWMQSIHFCEIMRRAAAEPTGVKSSEMLFFRKLLEDRRGSALNMRVMGSSLEYLGMLQTRMDVADYVIRLKLAPRGALHVFNRSC
jgi:hypothetical protein